MEKDRLEALSDGVFAIAITLLILDVRAPSPHVFHLGKALWMQWPHYLGYVVSFAVVGMIWFNHHGIFRLLRSADHRLLVLNLVLLAFVAFLPYPTSVMATFLRAGTDQGAAAAFYGGVLVLTSVSLASLWGYAASHHRLLFRHVTDEEVHRLSQRLFVAPLLYLVGMGMALVSATAGLVIFLGVACLYFLHLGVRVVPGHPPERGGYADVDR
jgi:TMEM175 potassium channel family protein